ncbi:MAG: hypothetical protein AAGU32_16535 [Bacillota bacterium]
MKQFTFSFNGYDVTGIVSFIIGAILTAIISGVISFYFSRRREKSILKLKVQIDTADKLQEMIKVSSDKSVALILKLDFDNYHQYKDNERLHQVGAQRFYKVFKKWDEDYIQYTESISSILFFIELREIVLVNFRVFHRELLNVYNNLIKKNQELFSIRLKIIDLAFRSMQIDVNTIEQFNNAYTDFQELKIDINSYLHDLQIGLQNEFYRKLFHHRIPKRKTADPAYKVLTAQKSKTSILEGED